MFVGSLTVSSSDWARLSQDVGAANPPGSETNIRVSTLLPLGKAALVSVSWR